MIPASNITDFERDNFMRKLSAEIFGASGLLVEDWEKRFVSGWRASARPSLWFIGGRKEHTDKLWRKYGLEIKFPYPVAPSRESAPVQADPDCCMFLVKAEDRWQRPCNEPATKVGKNGFLYCDEHGEQAQKAMKRRGGHMELRTYLLNK